MSIQVDSNAPRAADDDRPYADVPIFNALWREMGECSWRLENACRYAGTWFAAVRATHGM